VIERERELDHHREQSRWSHQGTPTTAQVKAASGGDDIRTGSVRGKKRWLTQKPHEVRGHAPKEYCILLSALSKIWRFIGDFICDLLKVYIILL